MRHEARGTRHESDCRLRAGRKGTDVRRMLLNFCDPYLRPEIKCSTVCTEGYEVTNLINGSDEGFLAFYCKRPPVHIDIKFVCNIWINHILIWPSVGNQKSTGFQFYITRNDDDTSYTSLSPSSYLTPTHTGLWLDCTTNVDDNIPVPVDFLRRRINMSTRSYLTTHARGLRVTIYKTCNSAPALGKIEVWGTVSRRYRCSFTESIHRLWLRRYAKWAVVVHKADDNSTNAVDNRQKDEAAREASLEIPEDFLDCITWKLMTLPIVLPSGNVIDITTLAKHKKHEESWGRPSSDPFTGLPFRKDRRPIMLTALKIRIDRFRQENSNLDEIEPRVLGHNPTSAMAGDRRLFEMPGYVSNTWSFRRTARDALSTFELAINNALGRKVHQWLPVTVISRQSTANIRLKKQTVKMPSPFPLVRNLYIPRTCDKDDKSEIAAIDIDVSLDSNTKILLPKIKCLNAPEKIELSIAKCKCCDNSVFYVLPCEHVICRKMLLSTKNNKCNFCGAFYKSCDVERIHVHISIK